jgi:PAS domain S-box-containing protein
MYATEQTGPAGNAHHRRVDDRAGSARGIRKRSDGERSMTQKPDWMEMRQSTRAKAEGLVASIAPAATAPAAQPTEILMHELLVNKIEFEAQIEELKRTHAQLEEARDRFEDLYNFSPVGFVTVGRECLIGEINLTAAALLGVDRRDVVNRRFSKFVAPADRDRWDRLFISRIEDHDVERKSFILELLRPDASTFRVYVDCQRREAAGSAPTLRLALVDVSGIRKAEEERIADAGPD